jgi:DNA repair protein RecO (recombination protein O)
MKALTSGRIKSTRTIHKTTSVILNSMDYGESDRILTFYTDDFGKLKGIAKGARRSKKRFPNALEPFSLSHIVFSRRERDTLALIESCDVINHHSGIRENLDKTLVSSYLLELTDKFTRDGKKDVDLFHLLKSYLHIIDMEKDNPSSGLVRFFEMRLLKISGYEPVFDRCMQCGKMIDHAEAYRFIPNKGGIKCRSCHPDTFDSFPVSVGTLKSLLLGKEIDIQKINRISLSEQAAHESGLILSRFIHHLLGKSLKSLSVLHQIREMGI